MPKIYVLHDFYLGDKLLKSGSEVDITAKELKDITNVSESNNFPLVKVLAAKKTKKDDE